MNKPIKTGPNALTGATKFDQAKADRSAGGRARMKAGQAFEQELEAVHYLYAMTGRALIHRAYPATRRIPGGQLVSAGVAPFDFHGVAVIAGEFGIPIAFDAKSCDDALYTHEPKALHQVRELRDWQKFGGRGFLLLRDRKLGIAYLVADVTALRALEAGGSIRLREPKKGGNVKLTVDDYLHYFPFVREPSELLISQSTPRWDWLELLEQEETLGRDQAEALP